MLFVFEVQIRPGYSVAEYARAWQAASELIQQAPGALGTRLHRAIGEDDRMLAIARWESKADRDATDNRPMEEIRAILDSQAPFVDIRVIGEFEEPEWVVLPPQ